MTKKYKAYSLIEVLLYMALTSMLVITLSTFYTSLMQARQRNFVVREVNEQAVFITDQLRQKLSDSSQVNTPAVGTQSQTLDIDTQSFGNIQFRVTNNLLEISTDGGPYQQLSTDSVTLTNLSFSNVSDGTTSDVITISFDLSYTATSNRAEENYSNSYQTTVTLKQ
jgi:hypothetical protein